MSEDVIKQVLNRMPYGFYAITSHAGEEINAMVANWVTQASFEPRLIALGLQKTCYTHGLIAAGRVFAVNLFLKSDQESIKPFTKGRAKNPDKMAEAAFAPAPVTGCPVLDGSAAYLECEVVEILDVGGDHDVVIGKVVGAGVQKEGHVKESLSLPDLGWSYAG